MQRFDMHIHANNTETDSKKILADMEKAGIFGGCVFSNLPKECDARLGTSFDQRLNEALAWCEADRSRLFPVLWIHPYEKNIKKNIDRAVEAGIEGFKIICTNFFVNEKPVLRLLSQIAETGRPVFFHSGILWDGLPSSKYNRPLNWEDLISIKKLRFSMGHCSWPWTDECISLYGKFLNSLTYNGESAEMFFDLTPGTPRIYRRDLLTKLFTIGYDVPDNILFGSDSSAECYNNNGWVEGWLKTDEDIYADLGVTDDIREKIYHDNILRFLGHTEKNFTHISPVPDSADTWKIGKKR